MLKALLIIYAIGCGIGILLLVLATFDPATRGARVEMWRFGLLAIAGWPYPYCRRIIRGLAALARWLGRKARAS
jgi:hypothetical protein